MRKLSESSCMVCMFRMIPLLIYTSQKLNNCPLTTVTKTGWKPGEECTHWACLILYSPCHMFVFTNSHWSCDMWNFHVYFYSWIVFIWSVEKVTDHRSSVIPTTCVSCLSYHLLPCDTEIWHRMVWCMPHPGEGLPRAPLYIDLTHWAHTMCEEQNLHVSVQDIIYKRLAFMCGVSVCFISSETWRSMVRDV